MISTEDPSATNGITESVQGMPGPHETGLFDVFAIVRRRKWLIAFGMVAGLALSYLYYSQATPIYESEVQILVMPKDSNFPTPGRSGGNDFQRESLDEDILSTHIQLLKSPRIVKQAIETHHLESLPSVAEAVAAGEHPVEHIIEQLDVTKGGEGRAKDARVLGATFRSPVPEDCELILNALVESYQDFLGKTFQDTSSEAVVLITQAKSELAEELKEKETAYREFRIQAPLIWKGEESLNVHQVRLTKIEESLSEITQQYTETQARLSVIEETLRSEDAQDYSDLDKLALLGSSYVQRLDLLIKVVKGDTASEAFLAAGPVREETAQTEYRRLLTLLLDEATLLKDYGEHHPKVETVREQIKLTKEYLENNPLAKQFKEPINLEPGELLAAHVGQLRHDSSELEKRRTELQKLAQQEEKAAKELVVYELQGETMRNEIARKTDLYEAVIGRLREINLIRDYGGYLTEVISPVERPTKPASPVLVLVLALGGVLGLFFGAGLAYVVDIADRTFRSPDEVCRALDLPIIAHIPSLVPAKEAVSQSVKEDGKPQVDPIVVAYRFPKGRQAEVFRGLRTAIYFSSHGVGHKVIQVTSPNMADGKTTVVVNLAVSMAQSGKKVLLLDCDFRRPQIGRLLDVKSEVGMSGVIRDEVELPDAIQTTAIENLWVLPCGPRPPNPSELLTLPRFEQLIKVLREQYDFVLIDSPPVLAVSDPSVIAPRVDGVLLTIRINKNGCPQAIQARNMLSSLGVELLGVVVNRSGLERGYGYGYYGGKYGNGYGSGYGYGYGAKYGYEDADGHGDKDGYYDVEEEASTTSAGHELSDSSDSRST